MGAEFYYQLSEEDKKTLIEWYQLTSESFSILKAHGYKDTEALKILRSVMTSKGVGSEKHAAKLLEDWLSAI